MDNKYGLEFDCSVAGFAVPDLVLRDSPSSIDDTDKDQGELRKKERRKKEKDVGWIARRGRNERNSRNRGSPKKWCSKFDTWSSGKALGQHIFYPSSPGVWHRFFEGERRLSPRARRRRKKERKKKEEERRRKKKKEEEEEEEETPTLKIFPTLGWAPFRKSSQTLRPTYVSSYSGGRDTTPPNSRWPGHKWRR